MKLLKLSFLSILILFCGCTAIKRNEIKIPPKPLWIADLSNTPYGSGKYFSRVVKITSKQPTDESMLDAEKYARNLLIENIMEESDEPVPNGDTFLSLEKELPMLDIREYFYDQEASALYILVAFNKSNLKEYLLTKLHDAQELVQNSIVLAEGFKKEKDYTKAIISYLEALSVLDYSATKKYLYQKIENDSSSDGITAAQIEAEIQTIILNIRIDIVSGNNQRAIIDRPLNEPIKLLVYFSYDGLKSPLKNFPIKVNLLTANAVVQGVLSTDENGFIEFSVTKVFNTQHASNIIEVLLDFEQFIGDTKKLIPVKTNVIYEISSQDQPERDTHG